MNNRVLQQVLLIALLALAAGGGAQAQESDSNLGLMTSLTEAVANELVTSLEGARDGRPVRIVADATTEEYRFIEQVFTATLADRGVQVFKNAAGPAAATQDDVLELRLLATEFDVTYPRIFRSYLIGGKKVRREARVTIVGTLVDPSDGAVLDVVEASRDAADQFGHGSLNKVEQGTYEFVRPPVPSSGWGRVVEPVFVSGIIVGLIYLFFSNQSDE